jgi:p24 family protein beta-1
MRFSLCTALAAASWIGAAVAHNIQLKAHSRECFHEELHSGDKMTVTFQVGDREQGGAGNLDIDFFVRHVPYERAPANEIRSTTPRTDRNTLCDRFRQATTLSMRREMANTHTVLAMRTGQPTAKRCPLTSTASSTCLSRILLQTRLKLKVREVQD